MLCVKAELISTRLLSKEDKQDMLNGFLPIDALLTHVKIWRDNKMPDYANGKFDVYRPKIELPMQRYRGIGKNVK